MISNVVSFFQGLAASAAFAGALLLAGPSQARIAPVTGSSQTFRLADAAPSIIHPWLGTTVADAGPSIIHPWSAVADAAPSIIHPWLGTTVADAGPSIIHPWSDAIAA